MTKRKSDFTLPMNSLDVLFSSQEERDDAKLERVKEIPLTELHPFKDHPFKIQNNEEMKRLIESIQKFGTLTPALARPMQDGGYELISGHRRLAACQVLGIETMPVIVRKMSDDEAVIAMVDANLQREHILPSEKAFAYKMKLDAIKHQGVTSAQVGQKLLSVEKVAEDAGESRNQIKRYIRLTYLIPELLSMVDENKIAFNPAVEISYLEQSEQRVLLNAMELNDCTPSHACLLYTSTEIMRCAQRIFRAIRQRNTAAEWFGMKRNIPAFSLLKMAKFIASANRLALPLAGRTAWTNIIALHGAGRGSRMNNLLRTSRFMWNSSLQSTEIRLTLYSPIPAR